MLDTLRIMLRQVNKSAARLLLAVMLLTFLAPGFGWQAIATHDEIAHASSAFGGAADHDHDHDHEHDAGETGHDDEAHGAAGHVLAHLPAFLSHVAGFSPVAPVGAHFADVRVEWPRISPEPPLRPPRHS